MTTLRSQLPILAAALIAAAPAFAQTGSQPIPEKTAPATPSTNLSDKLNKSNGIIQPKEVDPAIEKSAPKAEDPNVVAPPKGGSAAPQAK